MLEKYGTEIVISEKPQVQDMLDRYSSYVVISDENVFALYGEELFDRKRALLLPPGEESKTLNSAELCWKAMSNLGCDRHSLVIALGGGMVTDLAGFVAGCYMRGIDVMHIPTTLLGMVDAAIGGKTAVNVPPVKNLVGVLHHPKRVWINPSFLRTLSRREFCSGLAEVIKYGVIKDPEFFTFLEEKMENILQLDEECLKKIINRSCEIKAEIVNADEREQGERAILNWGHTFAHAIEAVTHYKKYLHGEAVAIGMCLAARLSFLLGEVEEKFIQKQVEICQKAELPTSLPDIPADQLIALMRRDKKSSFGKFSLIVAKKIGKVVRVTDVDQLLIEKTVV